MSRLFKKYVLSYLKGFTPLEKGASLKKKKFLLGVIPVKEKGFLTGFTLIELIVVIAIIAVLAGLVIIRIGSSSLDARNSKRRSDLNQIKAAIEKAKITGTVVNTTGCAAFPCGRPLSDAVFTASGSSSLPSTFLSNDAYPTNPYNGTPYRLRLETATDPTTNYI